MPINYPVPAFADLLTQVHEFVAELWPIYTLVVVGFLMIQIFKRAARSF